MATTQSIVSATTSTAIALGADVTRKYLYIRNYSDATLNPGQITFWVAFGKVATVGTGGEMEFPAGFEFTWDVAGEVPLESINVITSTGSEKGCVVTQ